MISKPLAKIAKVIAGQSPASTTYNSVGQGLPFFQGKADFQDMYPKVRMWCTSDKRKIAESGDILISVRAPVGAVNICNQKSIIGRGLSAIRPLPELDRLFLYYFLKANEERIDALGTGSTFKAITQDTLKKIEIPLPPLNDQIRIAHLLGKVEGLIAQRKQHLQQLDDLLKSQFLEMFGDLARNDMGWQYAKLDGYITHLTSGGRGWAKYYSDSGKRFIRSLDVQMNHIGKDDIAYVNPPSNAEADRTRVQSGDVLLTITGSKIGRVCFVPENFEEAYISQHVSIIRTKGINPVFLSFYLSAEHSGQRQIKKQQYGQAKPGLNLTQIRNFQVPLVDISIQNLFAVIFERIEAIKDRYQQSLTDLESLYGAISQQAFKGELDLSQVALSDVRDDAEVANYSEQVEITEAEDVSINFPDTEYLLDALTDMSLRERLLNEWLESYYQQIGRAEFSTDKFLATAQTRIAELHPDNDFELGTGDYDVVKKWVFDALASKKLSQNLDEANNRLRLTTGKSA
ncbi:restriction endonuclease subunit S [Pseudoalteromonas piscicida]|uniref:Restriction endonuclease subunit S n=1 Tax=Pseudoalteromonas piscicida TaxID=43662 RepID=A0AAD0RGV0_PSEO7|nr:restriction endonuclease subunit S [Pseudoalteromonas piscicida]ASD67861.1 hypothetical protein B1L02_13080 [Pseudoalteromonas piscicida]AXR01434.1 restriction endonuclease subunit S [Pseudoalteromonas piscicida]